MKKNDTEFSIILVYFIFFSSCFPFFVSTIASSSSNLINTYTWQLSWLAGLLVRTHIQQRSVVKSTIKLATGKSNNNRKKNTLNTHTLKCYGPVFRCRRIIYFIFNISRSNTLTLHTNVFSVFILISFHQFSLAFSLDRFICLYLFIKYNEMNAVENDILEHRKHYVRARLSVCFIQRFVVIYAFIFKHSILYNIIDLFFDTFHSKFDQHVFLEYPNRSLSLHLSHYLFLFLIVKLNDFHFTHLM